MRTQSALLAVTLVLALAAPASPEEKASSDAAEAKKAIEAVNARFGEAMRRGDAATIGSLYTEDAIVFPPDVEMVRGRAAIEAFWKSQMAGGVKDAVLTTVDVTRSGDLAAETGRVALTVQPKGKEAAKASAKYVVVWKRASDGAWQLHRDIWNAAPAGK